MAPVKIRITSKARGVKCKDQIYSVADTRISWVELLKSHKVRLPKHCNFWIRSPGFRNATIPEESIQHFLDGYKCIMDFYTATIAKANRFTKGQLLERRLQLKLQNGKVSGGKRHSTSPPAKSYRPQVEQPAPRLTRYDSRSTCAEDNIGLQETPMRQKQIYQADVGFNDAASMLSQDSQDEQDDGGLVKHKVIRRIREKISYGDLVRIMNEHKEMKRRGKMMKVARHVPQIMNFLNVVLDQ